MPAGLVEHERVQPGEPCQPLHVDTLEHDARERELTKVRVQVGEVAVQEWIPEG